jgi:hypothetical protein
LPRLTVAVATVVFATVVVVTAGTAGAAVDSSASGGPFVGQQAGAVSCAVSDVTAAEVRTAERTATARLDELRALNDRSADVDRSVLSSVQYHIEDGRLRRQNEAYCQAHRAFETAREQAVAELTRVYRVEAAAVLNATAGTVAGLRMDGYRTLELYTLAERVDRQQTRLANVDSLADARAAHERATALRDESKEVAPGWQVALTNTLLSPFGAVVAVILLLAGVYCGRHIAPLLSAGDTSGVIVK